MKILAAIRACGAEVHWWARAAFRLLRLPAHVAVAASVLWLVGWGWVAFPLGLVALSRTWIYLAPMSWERYAAAPGRHLAWRMRLRRTWLEVAAGCGLSRRVSRRGWRAAAGAPQADDQVPQLRRVTAEGPRMTAHVRPLVGQTVETYVEASEALRMAVGATRVRVDPEGVNEIALTFTIGDSLGAPFSAQPPRPSDTAFDTVVLGLCEDGSRWRLPVGPHTLVAGMSGAGKASVFWSFALAMAPAVRTGVVQLHGIDLKGGMEVLMGAELFTSRATTAAEAVTVLERLVHEMRERTHAYAGRVRSHQATAVEPLHVVMVDELAALTAYCPERDLQRRAEMAINLLCSQGRAPGFMVFACLQDPRKEVIPSRGLFTQMIGLRLKDATETAMVLGETALISGAMCHRISRTTPGVGYVLPEDGSFPIRVRAGLVTDADIRDVAHAYAAPTAVPTAETATDGDVLRLVADRRLHNAP